MSVPAGPDVPMQAVPTGVVRGPDGAIYVSQLTGFPFPIGGARIFRIDPQGEWEQVAEWDGEPNGMKFLDDGVLVITDPIGWRPAHDSASSWAFEQRLLRWRWSIAKAFGSVTLTESGT